MRRMYDTQEIKNIAGGGEPQPEPQPAKTYRHMFYVIIGDPEEGQNFYVKLFIDTTDEGEYLGAISFKDFIYQQHGLLGLYSNEAGEGETYTYDSLAIAYSKDENSYIKVSGNTYDVTDEEKISSIDEHVWEVGGEI